jgi:hypothetical protein
MKKIVMAVGALLLGGLGSLVTAAPVTAKSALEVSQAKYGLDFSVCARAIAARSSIHVGELDTYEVRKLRAGNYNVLSSTEVTDMNELRTRRRLFFGCLVDGAGTVTKVVEFVPRGASTYVLPGFDIIYNKRIYYAQ